MPGLLRRLLGFDSSSAPTPATPATNGHGGPVGEWRGIARLDVLGPPPLTVQTSRFEKGLTTRTPFAFARPLDHGRSDLAPSGLVDGLAVPALATAYALDGADFPLVQRLRAHHHNGTPTAVQRHPGLHAHPVPESEPELLSAPARMPLPEPAPEGEPVREPDLAPVLLSRDVVRGADLVHAPPPDVSALELPVVAARSDSDERAAGVVPRPSEEFETTAPAASKQLLVARQATESISPRAAHSASPAPTPTTSANDDAELPVARAPVSGAPSARPAVQRLGLGEPFVPAKSATPQPTASREVAPVVAPIREAGHASPRDVASMPLETTTPDATPFPVQRHVEAPADEPDGANSPLVGDHQPTPPTAVDEMHAPATEAPALDVAESPRPVVARTVDRGEPPPPEPAQPSVVAARTSTTALTATHPTERSVPLVGTLPLAPTRRPEQLTTPQATPSPQTTPTASAVIARHDEMSTFALPAVDAVPDVVQRSPELVVSRSSMATAPSPSPAPAPEQSQPSQPSSPTVAPASPAPVVDGASAIVVSREADTPTPETPTPGEPPAPSPPTGGAGAGGALAAGSVSPATTGATTNVDELSERLYDRIRDRLCTELRHDRERAGLLTDVIR